MNVLIVLTSFFEEFFGDGFLIVDFTCFDCYRHLYTVLEEQLYSIKERQCFFFVSGINFIFYYEYSTRVESVRITSTCLDVNHFTLNVPQTFPSIVNLLYLKAIEIWTSVDVFAN